MPGLQEVHTAALLAPVTELYVPAPHAVQLVVAVVRELYEPAAQDKHGSRAGEHANTGEYDGAPPKEKEYSEVPLASYSVTCDWMRSVQQPGRGVKYS